jgi:hypothetical protein
MKDMKQQQHAFGDTAPLEIANPKPAEWSPVGTGARRGKKNPGHNDL